MLSSGVVLINSRVLSSSRSSPFYCFYNTNKERFLIIFMKQQGGDLRSLSSRSNWKLLDKRVLAEENQGDIVEFYKKEGLVLLADETLEDALKNLEGVTCNKAVQCIFSHKLSCQIRP
ncbi:unnamed protein product [Lactuca virosa]|uniref:Uncharacterized protein n=1 Tax=Lactuca virosa TaxID=75947 RepID=A0AAU9MFI0_9ASTR|nr:unnamed protein product [Lactuca virosa]